MSIRTAYLLTAVVSFAFGVIAMDISQLWRDQGQICAPVNHKDHNL